MTVSDIVRLLRAKLSTLNSAHATASANGDIDQVIRLEGEISETQATLDQLLSLPA